MIKPFNETLTNFEFTRENLVNLEPYFNINFPEADLNEKKTFFHNMRKLARQSLGLSHAIQHNIVPKIIVQMSNCNEAKEKVLSKDFNEVIGCYSIVKRSDAITLNGLTLNGRKQWFSNLDQADYAVMQIDSDEGVKLIWMDLHNKDSHELDYNFFTPIGMEIAKAGTLVVDNHELNPEHILGIHGTEMFFNQSNFASYCFISNHCGLTHQLFLDIKEHAKKFNYTGADFELNKLETEVATMLMQWEENLDTLGETIPTNEFWNRRNTQYAYSKKTLIRVIQFILEIGVTYYTDAKSEFSQRYRDALTFCSHMHPLYKFGQEFYQLDLNTYD